MATSIAASGKSVWGFSPQSIPGLAWWLDGADTTSMTFSSGSNISTWKDKSGKGCNATGFNSPQKISTGGVSFVASSSNYFTMNVTYSPTQTMFMVASPVPSTDANQYYINTNPVNKGGIFLGGYNSSFISYYNNTITNFASGTTTTPFVVSLAKVAGVTSVGTYNGSQAFSIAANTADSATSSWTVLGGSASNANLLTASIYEFIIFNVALPTTQIQQVEGYLASKWGLKANLPATHPYSAATRVPFNRPFYPTDIGGCSLWLDGADTGSMAFSSATTISVWKDKSGNGNDATANNSPTLSQSSINSVQAVKTISGAYFGGSISMSGPSLTCFAIATTNVTLPNIRSPRADQRLVSLAAATGEDTAAGSVIPLFNQDSTCNIATFNNTLGTVASNPIVTGVPFMAVTRYDGTTGSLWFNGNAGSLASSSSTSNFNTTKYGIGQQANAPRSEYWSGFIGEVILFNTALTTSQRQQVEQYLTWKWGLPTANLPTGHPGKLLPAFGTVSAPPSVTYLVVGGGGGGGSRFGGGGGGGGFLTGNLAVWISTSYAVTVGAGGAGGPGSGGTPANPGQYTLGAMSGSNGSSSVFGSVTALGGGGGGAGDAVNGVNGASGGGGAGRANNVDPYRFFTSGGTGISGQGFAGAPSRTGSYLGGGGGGAGAAAVDPSGARGKTSSITGTSVTYAGGGGGGGSFDPSIPNGGAQNGAPGGAGGGGLGGPFSGGTATAGTANTGGGGGGGAYNSNTTLFSNNNQPGANGGSGVVILAYPSTYNGLLSSVDVGLTYTVNFIEKNIVYTFTSGSGNVRW